MKILQLLFSTENIFLLLLKIQILQDGQMSYTKSQIHVFFVMLSPMYMFLNYKLATIICYSLQFKYNLIVKITKKTWLTEHCQTEPNNIQKYKLFIRRPTIEKQILKYIDFSCSIVRQNLGLRQFNKYKMFSDQVMGKVLNFDIFANFF